MTHIQPGEIRQENPDKPEGRLPGAGVLLGAILITLNPWAAFAQDPAEVPEANGLCPLRSLHHRHR